MTLTSKELLSSGRQILSSFQSQLPRSAILRLSAPTRTHRSMTTTTRLRSLNIDNINQHVKEAKYAVRGEIANRAENYRNKLAGRKVKDVPDKLPFETVISANIGNPQQLDQKPITFFRQVLSLLEYPQLLESPEILKKSLGYEQDVIDRASWLLKEAHSVGAYSHSQGVPVVRDSVARFIERRDGHPADPQDIFLTAGASGGVNTILTVLCSSPNTGVLVPIPQYPLYTATLALLGAKCVPYYLDESADWGVNMDALRESIKKGKDEGTDVRAIVIINPGNPTGASLPAEDVRNIVKFAAEEKLVIMADEVYQTNDFKGSFTSFKKTLRDLQKEQPGKFDTVELVSMHSISKGMVGECGHRGGYFEMIGFDPEVVAQIYKFVSISLCPAVVGQCLLELMVNPPKEGDPSYPLYRKEYDAIFQGLQDRAAALYKTFKGMEGVEIAEPKGAMYLFPTIKLPEKAIEAAKEENRQADEFYCLRLLDATGICVVPGSGFGQAPNTLHFRSTFLAPGTEWVDRISKFHKEFMDEFRGSASASA